jgi:hypothetical protein
MVERQEAELSQARQSGERDQGSLEPENEYRRLKAGNGRNGNVALKKFDIASALSPK